MRHDCIYASLCSSASSVFTVPLRIQKKTLILSSLVLSSFIQLHAQTSILGFTPTSAAHESSIEEKFKSIPTPDEERRQQACDREDRQQPAPEVASLQAHEREEQQRGGHEQPPQPAF